MTTINSFIAEKNSGTGGSFGFLINERIGTPSPHPHNPRFWKFSKNQNTMFFDFYF
jgi:hypothetical protein